MSTEVKAEEDEIQNEYEEEDEYDENYEEPARQPIHESIINQKDLINITKMKSPELEERLMMIIMSLESLLGRCQFKTKFTNFLSLLVEEYKEEQKLGKGKGITIQDTLNSLRLVRTNIICN